MLLETQLKALALLNMFVIYRTLCWLHSWRQSLGSQATSQSFKQTMNSQGGHFARTFALICVFVKNCLCGYNFPVPMEKIKKKKKYVLSYFNNIHSYFYTHNTYTRKRSSALEKCLSDTPGEGPSATAVQQTPFKFTWKALVICYTLSISGHHATLPA